MKNMHVREEETEKNYSMSLPNPVNNNSVNKKKNEPNQIMNEQKK